MNLNINKSDWIKVKLNEVCEWYQKDIPNDEQIDFGVEYYVTANHIDSDSIKFDRYSELADGQKGPTITKHFEKGDLLLSTRSVALRKAALAPVDGVTGEKLLVLRVKPESLLLRELMPFVFQSIDFWEYAQNSASGSVNKFTSWTKIREYEFLLPPKDQQAQLAQLLWAMDDVIEREKIVLNKTLINLEVKTSELIWDNNYDKQPIKTYASEKVGKFVDGDWIESKDQSDEGVRLLQLADIGVREFINKSSRFVSHDTFDRLKCFEVLPNDVLIARMPEPIGRACLIPESDEKMITAVDCCIARVNPDINSNKFLMYLINSREFLHKANLLASGTTRQRIARKTLEEMKVPKPNLEKQLEIVSILDALMVTRQSCNDKILSSQSLQKSLISQVF